LGLSSLFGYAFRYADLTQNDGRFVGAVASRPEPGSVLRYITEVRNGKMEPLDFTLYLPPGMGSVNGYEVPNVEESPDPAKILTASFNGGKETWQVG
jgi:hypothetical protein